MNKKQEMINSKAIWETAKAKVDELVAERKRCSREIRKGNDKAEAAMPAILNDITVANDAEVVARDTWQSANIAYAQSV